MRSFVDADTPKPEAPADARLARFRPVRRQHDPARLSLLVPATAYVFGNEVGEPVTTIRESWTTTCRAPGITDLHFHDLRREFACRLLESSADLHDVRDFLGHANVTTTSTYLRSTPVRLARALDRLDPGTRARAPANQQQPDPPDWHTIRTNQAVHENGRPEGPAVTH